VKPSLSTVRGTQEPLTKSSIIRTFSNATNYRELQLIQKCRNESRN